MSFDRFIQDGQDPKVIEKISGKLNDMLMPNETLSYIALQKKPAVTLLPDSIAISNKRIFLCEFTKLGLATNFEIFPWKDIKDIAFKEEIFGSRVTVIPFTGENLSIDYIPKTQARKLFQLIKEALANVGKEEEAPFIKPNPVIETPKATPIIQKVEEKPVVIVPPVEDRSSEEQIEEVYKPAEFSKPIIVETEPIRVPEITTPTTVSTASPAAQEEDDEITLKLKKLKNLYDKQLITQAEYESKKAEVLSQL